MISSPVARTHRRVDRLGRTAIAIALCTVLAACGQASDYVAGGSGSELVTSGVDGADGDTGSSGDSDGGDSNGGDSNGDSNGSDSNGSDSNDGDSEGSGSGGSGSNDGDSGDGSTTEAAGGDSGSDSDGDVSAGGGADGDTDDPAGPTIPTLVPQIVNTFPHDPTAFTQGLEYLDGVLFESTGLYGESSRRRVGLTNGVISSSLPLTDDLFGGGLALVGEGTVIQLTWKEGIAILADPITLQEFDRFTYEGEGWGLCDQGEQLVMSDGTSTLTLRDPMSFAAVGTVSVTRAGEPVERLNELACVGGFVWANVWLTNDIVQIDPSTGDVVAVVDASSLVPTGITDEENVLNGIAYNPVDETFFITGKRWDVLYEVDFVES